MSRIDWETFEKSIRGEVEEAARRTNEELAGQISTLVRLTDEEVQRLFPRKADKARLVKLMAIVRSAESRNAKARRLIENVEELAETAVKLLEKLV